MERVYWTSPDSFEVESELAPFFNDALSREYRPYRDGDFSLAFGISDGGSRQVDFVSRMRGRGEWRGPLLEVRLADDDCYIRLGPYFGIEESACVVVSGYQAAFEVCYDWLDQANIATVISATEFLNRQDLAPLKPLGTDLVP